MKLACRVFIVTVISMFCYFCGPKVKMGGSGQVGGGGVGGQGQKVVEISEKAKETFKEAVEEFKKHEQAGNWDADSCKRVADMFRDASKEQKNGLPTAIFNAGLVYERCGNDGEAKSMFKKALQMEPNYSSPRIMLANYAYREGNVSLAEKMYADAIKGAPLALETVEAYVNLAHIQRKRKSGNRKVNLKEALRNLRRALAIDSQNMEAFTEMAYLHLDMAEQDKNKLTFAEVVCVQATKINPQYAPIYNVWGLLKMRQGEIVDALKYFERAFTLDPKMFEAYMNFGSITIGFRGYEDAQRVFSRAVELQPDSYDAVVNLGVAKRGLEDYEGAEKEYLRAIEIDRRRPEAYFNMGILYQDYYLDKAGESGFENFKIAMKWYNDFLARARSRADLDRYVKEAEKRIENCKKAIQLIKEAAQLMKEAQQSEQQQQQEKKEMTEGVAPSEQEVEQPAEQKNQ